MKRRIIANGKIEEGNKIGALGNAWTIAKKIIR